MSEPTRSNSKLNYGPAGKALQTQADNSPNAQLQQHKAFLDARLGKISEWVKHGVDPRALVRYALADMAAPTKAGEKLRTATRESIYLGLLACAVTGLEPGSLRGEAYLVPYAGVATFIPGWRGLVKQARRSREVVAIASQVVREHDHFDLDLGAGAPPVHKPLLRGDRGPVIGAYAVAKLVGSRESVISHEVEWLDLEDLNAIRTMATKHGTSPAWTDWEDQMQRKAPIRRLCKRLPMNEDYFVAMALDEAADSGASQRAIIDIETSGEAGRAELQVGSAAEIAEQAGSIPPDEQAEILAREARGG